MHTCIISALAFATPEATVPIPASDTSLTDTFALGLTCLLIFGKSDSKSWQNIYSQKELPDEDQRSTVPDPLWNKYHDVEVEK